MDHVLSVSTTEGGKVQLRAYFMSFKASDSRIPKVDLAPMGPYLDFSLRRVQHASAALEKEANRIPKE
jgi:ribosome production factor 2